MLARSDANLSVRGRNRAGRPNSPWSAPRCRRGTGHGGDHGLPPIAARRTTPRAAAGHRELTPAPDPAPPRAYAAGFSPPLILTEALLAASCSVLVDRCAYLWVTLASEWPKICCTS